MAGGKGSQKGGPWKWKVLTGRGTGKGIDAGDTYAFMSMHELLAGAAYAFMSTHELLAGDAYAFMSIHALHYLPPSKNQAQYQRASGASEPALCRLSS